MLPMVIHDLQDSQMFALAQAAGRSGIPVVGTNKVAAPWSYASRYVHQVVPMAALNDSGSGAYALNLCQSGLSGVWLPGVDDTALFTARYRALLEHMGMRFLSADAEVMQQAHDFWRLPKTEGLDMPFGGRFSLGEIRARLQEWPYPLLIKHERTRYRRIDNAVAFESFLNELEMQGEYLGELVLQAYIKGDVTRMATAMLLFDDEGRPVRGFTGRRLRVAPTAYGPFGETTAAKAEWLPELYEGAVELLSSLGWRGFAEVECKQHQGGRWQVMEVNRRISGWACLAEADGAGMLTAYYRICADGVRLDEACLQRSRASYVRVVATRAHDPDWGVASVANDSMGRRLGRLFTALWQEWRNPSEISLGAWDRRDARASLLLLFETVRCLWRKSRGDTSA